MSRSTGVRRKVDDLGRIVIPAGIRKTLDIRDGDALEFTVDGDRIIIDRATDRCVVCGHQGLGLHEVHERRICTSCIDEVAALGASDTEGEEDSADVPVDSAPGRLQRESADLDELRRELYDPASTTAW